MFGFIPSTVYISSKDKVLDVNQFLWNEFYFYFCKYNIDKYYIERSNCEKIVIIATVIFIIVI